MGGSGFGCGLLRCKLLLGTAIAPASTPSCRVFVLTLLNECDASARLLNSGTTIMVLRFLHKYGVGMNMILAMILALLLRW